MDALSTLAHPCPGVPDVLARLTELKVPFSIATTSGKPRVPVSVVSCGFTDYFPPEAIHSGESDFDPAQVQARPERVPARGGVHRRRPGKLRRRGGFHVGRRIGGECEDRSHRRVRRRVAHRLRERRGARRDVNVGRTRGRRQGRGYRHQRVHRLTAAREALRRLDAKPAPVTFPKSLIESLESKIYVDQTRVA